MRKCIPFLLLLTLPLYGETLDQAPRFHGKNLDGESVSLDSLLADGPVFVSFWALWCKPCIRELDELMPVWEKFHEDGFEIVAVSQDGPRSVSRVKPMVRSKGWNFTVLLDPNKDLSRAFQVVALPTSFLIATDGNIVRAQQGYKPGMEETVESEVEELLAALKEDEESAQVIEPEAAESAAGSEEDEKPELPLEEETEEIPSSSEERGCSETETEGDENSTE